VWGVEWGNSSSKAFGISFADRPKAKRQGVETFGLRIYSGGRTLIQQIDCVVTRTE
jgi:hypothetical protein